MEVTTLHTNKREAYREEIIEELEDWLTQFQTRVARTIVEQQAAALMLAVLRER